MTPLAYVKSMDRKDNRYSSNHYFFRFQFIPTLTLGYQFPESSSARCLMPCVRDFILSAVEHNGIKTESEDPMFFDELKNRTFNVDVIPRSDGKPGSKRIVMFPVLEIRCTGRLKDAYERILSHTEKDNIGAMPHLSLVIVKDTSLPKPAYGIYAAMHKDLPAGERFSDITRLTEYYGYKSFYDFNISSNGDDEFSFLLMLLVGYKAWKAITDRLGFLRSSDMDGMALRFSERYAGRGMPESFVSQTSKRFAVSSFVLGMLTEVVVCCVCLNNGSNAVPLFNRYTYVRTSDACFPPITEYMIRNYINDDSQCVRTALLDGVKSRKLRDTIKLSFML